MRVRRVVYFVWLLFLMGLNAEAAKSPFMPKDLYIKDFKDTLLPEIVSKDFVINSVKKMQTLKGIAYVDLGDFTDFMHGHILFKFKEESSFSLADLKGDLKEEEKDSPVWSEVKMVGILFHSQEYRGQRDGKGYHGRFGELDALNRNWIYLLEDNSYGKAGSIIDANLVNTISKDKKERVHTVFAYKIEEEVFGAGFSKMTLPYYFFRIACDQSAYLKESNVFEVSEKEESGDIRACLVIQSFKCRNHDCRTGQRVEHLTEH